MDPLAIPHRWLLFGASAALALTVAACNGAQGPASNQDNAAEAANTAGTIDGGGPAAANADAAVAEGSAIPCPFGGTKGWEAWVDAMMGPGKVRTLIAKGDVDVGSDGYAGRLIPGLLDKSLPPIQHFELNLVEKAGAKKGWQPVRAEVKPATTYKAVVIDCHGTQVGKVEPVPIAH